MPAKLRIYNSHEEAAADEVKRVAEQSPIARIKEAVELILRVYNVSRQELSNRPKNNRITIVEYRDEPVL